MVLAFSGDLTIRKADEIRTRLIESLSSEDGKIIVSCREVDEVDLSFIQLMVSARKSAAASGRQLVLAAPADGALRDALIRGGFVADAEAADRFWIEGE